MLELRVCSLLLRWSAIQCLSDNFSDENNAELSADASHILPGADLRIDMTSVSALCTDTENNEDTVVAVWE